MTNDEIREQIKSFRIVGDAAWARAEAIRQTIATMRNAEITAITNWAKAEALEVMLRMKETEQ